MNKALSTILKTGGILLGVLIILIVIASLMLNTKSVQNKVAKYATELLANKLQTKVSIDSVSISIIGQKIELWGLYVEDQEQRKMLQLKEVAVDLKLMALMKNQIVIEAADITGLDVLLLKPSKEEPANYQFIIDAFKNEKKDSTTAETDKKPKQKMSLDISQVKLSDIHIRYNDQDFVLGHAKVMTKDILKKYEADIEDIRTNWTSQSKKGPVDNQAGIAKLTLVSNGSQYNAEISGLHFKNDNHMPRKNTGKPHRGFFDAKHLDITANLKLTIDSIGKDTVIAQITECQARDSVTGIDIRDLRTKIFANKEKAHLHETTIQQKNTVLSIKEAELTLPSKKEGRKFSYSTGVIKGRTLLQDISRTFAPVLSKFTLPLNLTVRMSGTDSTITFRDIHVGTDDKKLSILANGGITNLKDAKKLDIRFHVSRMTAKSGIKEKIISQFPVKKLMMKPLHNLGNISFVGDVIILWKQESFKGNLGTAAGPLNFHFTLDGLNKYVSGHVSATALELGKVFEMDGIGTVKANADFKIDISKPRTALMRRKKGGKLPIGTVSAVVEDCSYKKIHVRNLTTVIESDGAIASGDIRQHGIHRDLYCSFSFTNTDEMRKMKITHPGIKFHKASEEDKKARDERRQLKKEEKAKAKEKKKQEQGKQPKKKRFGLF